MAFSQQLRRTALALAGVLPIAMASGAKAAPTDCATASSASFGLPGFECVSGDKTFSNFVFSDFSAFSNLYIVDNFPALTHAFGGNISGGISTTKTVSYKVTANDPKYQIASIGSTILGLGSGTHAFTTPAAGPNPFSTPLSYVFNPVTNSADITYTLTFASVQGITFENLITQAEQTPGPLAVLGAVSAFGYSRKMRKRIISAG